jgi:hypothetical protein
MKDVAEIPWLVRTLTVQLASPRKLVGTVKTRCRRSAPVRVAPTGLLVISQMIGVVVSTAPFELVKTAVRVTVLFGGVAVRDAEVGLSAIDDEPITVTKAFSETVGSATDVARTWKVPAVVPAVNVARAFPLPSGVDGAIEPAEAGITVQVTVLSGVPATIAVNRFVLTLLLATEAKLGVTVT